MARVMFIQDPGPRRDLSSAVQYGDIEFMLTGDDSPSHRPAACLSKIKRHLNQRDFLYYEDYVVWAGGDPMAPLLAGYALADSGIRKLRMLRWEREKNSNGKRSTTRGFYVPVDIALGNL